MKEITTAALARSPFAKAVSSMIPTAAKHEAQKMMPKKALEKLPFFKKMKPADQIGLMEDTRDFLGASLMEGVSKLARGMYLSRIQERLTPYGAFYRYLSNFRVSRKTMYRYIAGYKNAAQHWPASVIKAAIAKGIDIVGTDASRPLGQYTESVRVLPPPSRALDEEGAGRYIDQLVQTDAERKKRIRKRNEKQGNSKQPEKEVIEFGDPETLLKQAYRSTTILMRKLPNNHKARQKFMENLVGMLLAKHGIASPQQFTPIAVPDGFEAVRGRPTLVKEAEKAEGKQAATGS